MNRALRKSERLADSRRLFLTMKTNGLKPLKAPGFLVQSSGWLASRSFVQKEKGRRGNCTRNIKCFKMRWKAWYTDTSLHFTLIRFDFKFWNVYAKTQKNGPLQFTQTAPGRRRTPEPAPARLWFDSQFLSLMMRYVYWECFSFSKSPELVNVAIRHNN